MKCGKLVLTICLVALVLEVQADDHPSLALAEEWQPRTLSELDSEYWNAQAQDLLSEKIKRQAQPNRNTAKNIILFLGDGMSLPTVTAARAYQGDVSEQVYFEKFPYFGLSKTFCVDRQVPDSASTSTAYLSGVKANYGTIGVTAAVPRSNCELGQNPAYHTESIAKWAQDAGKWAGLVTTARVTHASPAGVYAHVADREWEHDKKVLKDDCNPEENLDIARQLVEWPVGRGLRVIMGGGRRAFFNETLEDEEGEPGKRYDGRNLIDDWLADKLQNDATASYAWNKRDLLKTDLKKTDYLLGLFSSSHMPYHGDLEREELTEDVPSLSEMTRAAIELLSRSERGYFLFVEGAQIDMAHHDTRARRALEETEEFARAVEIAHSMTSEEDTLIVTTADHAHTMTINGYPLRGADILGLNKDNAADGLPYTILSYANGPGHEKTYGKKGRKDLDDKDFNNPKRKYMATVPLESETHGGDDVGVFASGPFAHYFGGNYLQSDIPVLMAKAASIGPYGKVRET